MPQLFADIVLFQPVSLGALVLFIGLITWNLRLHIQLHQRMKSHSEALSNNDFLRTQLLHSKNHIDQIIERRTAELEEGNLQLSTTNLELFEKQEKLNNTIEELTQTQNRMVQSEKLRSMGVFTAGIAHEINNPINYISSATNVLLELIEGLEKNPTQLHENKAVINYAKKAIETGIDRTVSIISSLRSYAAPQNYNFISYDVIKCINDALFLVPNNPDKSCKILTDLSDEIIVDCDPGKMTQVFVNLLLNAIDTTNGQGSINIRGYKKDDMACFEISDTGEGIKRDNLKRVFDPFYTTKETGRGTGIGLYIVHGIITLHCGQINISSEVGLGTKVNFQIPIQSTHEFNNVELKNQYHN